MIVLFFLGLTLILGARWFPDYFNDLSLYEIIYHLKAPMEGVSLKPFADFALSCVLPAAVFTVLLAVIRLILRKHKKVIDIGGIIAFPLMCFAAFVILDSQLGIIAYTKQNDSDFIEDNYVDPKNVTITFPEKKRNLIYIYLESTEITFADKESGGAFDENIIPNLTRTALENECFGDGKTLNGGVALPATTWTMGAMTGMTAGIPLKIPVYNNYMDTQGEFFPNMTALGDILEENGYTNELLVGSDSTFGGRRLYFETHGDYRIFDFITAFESGRVNKKVFWGFEDFRLYEYAKKELSALYEEGKPFNFTMLTVDTHFEDGYTCELCPTKFDTPYANVYACADSQVYRFLKWLEGQPFYEDSTIILAGDHPTMDRDFCEDVTDYERRTYTAIINSPAVRKINVSRYYTTLDMFPTTLSAMGAKIEGDRLGLGTDLYSDTPTLLEKYGREYMTAEFEKNSGFMDDLNTFSVNQALADRMRYENGLECFESNEGLTVVYALRFDVSQVPGFDHLEAEVTCGDTVENITLDKLNTETLNYSASKKVFSGKTKNDVHITITLWDESGNSYIVADSDEEPNFTQTEKEPD